MKRATGLKPLKFVDTDFAVNWLREIVDSGLSQLEGCCGVGVLSELDNGDDKLEQAERDIENYNLELAAYKEDPDNEGCPMLTTNLHGDPLTDVPGLLERYSLVIATTANQPTAERMLQALGFEAVTTFKSITTHNNITVWHWRRAGTTSRAKRQTSRRACS